MDAKISFVAHVHEGRHQDSPGSDHIFSPSQFYPDPLWDDEIIDISANTTTAIWISIPITKNVIIDQNGYIVTNNHVIKDADEIKVTLDDGRDLSQRHMILSFWLKTSELRS